MEHGWNVLIVDDEPDVHTISELALKRRTWKGRPFVLTSAMSAKEAREKLQQSKINFNVAVVDVVMESDHAGLDVCTFIRDNFPLSLRIILRTGQPGMAPEEEVLNEYEIDQYLAKAELNDEKLFAALRTACRSSLDIATLLSLEKQLRGFTAALQRPSSGRGDLVHVMQDTLAFIAAKHRVRLAFIDDVANPTTSFSGTTFVTSAPAPTFDETAVREVLGGERWGDTFILLGETSGLPAGSLLAPVWSLDPPPAEKGGLMGRGGGLRSIMGREAASAKAVVGGFYIDTAGRAITPKEIKALERDLKTAAGNWKLAFANWHLRETIIRERIEADERED